MSHADFVSSPLRRPGHADVFTAVGRRLDAYLVYLLASLDVARQRRQLMALDDRSLSDIGLSRTDAYREARRGFWDIPEQMMPDALRRRDG